jgi:hypothetical protein
MANTESLEVGAGFWTQIFKQLNQALVATLHITDLYTEEDN